MCTFDHAATAAPIADPVVPAAPWARSRGAARPRSFAIEWARSAEDVREAQRLRHRVFSLEMGARLSPPPGSAPGLDVDAFDAFCDHLLVRAGATPDACRGEVIGTYRVLSPARARAAGGYYTDSEFDLAPLAALRPRAAELGRSCVHAHWRSGSVIMAMWSALAQYMQRRGLDTMIGCASVSLADGGHGALALWQQLRNTHLAPPRWQVQPFRPMSTTVPLEAARKGATGASAAWNTPPLVKGYLRCGARVLGPPALDAAFNTADLPMMLRLQEMAPRYRRHFLDVK